MKPLLIPTALVVFTAVSIGCRPEDEIRTYRVASPETPAATAADAAPVADAPPAAPQGDPTDRMIGAIVPGPGQAWFFKAVGPIEAVRAQAEAIESLLASVRFDGDEPTWKTPEGWNERRGEGMRLATIEVPAGDGAKPIELSVIGLPLVGEWDAQVLDNVNRWRKQLRLDPLAAEALSEKTKPLEEVAKGAVLTDATGWFDGGTMPPFAGGGAPFAGSGAPFAGAAAPAAPAPPVEEEPRRPDGSGELKYEKPDGWVEGPANPMRKASLRTTEGAEVSAFAFPATGAMGDPLENVNRWRREIGLEAVEAADLDGATEEVTLLGGEGTYYELVGATETTYAAMVEQDGLVWFFKLRGPGEAVAQEREAFRSWLKSLSL